MRSNHPILQKVASVSTHTHASMIQKSAYLGLPFPLILCIVVEHLLATRPTPV